MAPNPRRRTVDPKTGIVKFPRYTIASTGRIPGDFKNYGTVGNPSKEFVKREFTGEFNFYNPKTDSFPDSLTTTVDDPKPQKNTQGSELGSLAGIAGTALMKTPFGENIASSLTDLVTPTLKPILGDLISTGGETAGDILSTGTEAAGGLSGFFGGTPSSIGSSIMGSGLGVVVGLLGGKSPMEAVKGAALGLAGKVIGGAIGGPVGAFIGGALFSAIGGRVICNELVRQGVMDRRSVVLDYKFTRERLTPQHVNGYHVWAVHVVKRLRKGKGVKLWKHIASHRANEIAYIYGERDTPDYLGKVYRHIGEPACWLIGAFCKKTDWSILYNPKEI